MNTENQKTEGSKSSDQSQTTDQTEWMNGDLGKLIALLNQPGIASILANVGLYFAINPKAIKNALEEVQKTNKQMIEMMNELLEENVKIKEQIKKITAHVEDNQPSEGQMNGYRKVYKRSGSAYLD